MFLSVSFPVILYVVSLNKLNYCLPLSFFRKLTIGVLLVLLFPKNGSVVGVLQTLLPGLTWAHAFLQLLSWNFSCPTPQYYSFFSFFLFLFFLNTSKTLVYFRPYIFSVCCLCIKFFSSSDPFIFLKQTEYIQVLPVRVNVKCD